MIATDKDAMHILSALSHDNQRLLFEVFGLSSGDQSPEEQLARIRLAIDLRRALRRRSAH
jgi:hypothetical protein